MASVEERIAYLEGRVEEHTRAMDEFRDAVRQIDRRFDGLAARVDALDLKIDRVREELGSRIDALDLKVDRFRDELGGHIDALDRKLDARFDSLDQKASRTFLWVVGVQMTVLLAVIGALVRG